MLRMTLIFESASVYLIETNADGRPATIRFERRDYSSVGGRGYFEDGASKRELTEVELAAFRAAFVKLKICSTAADGREVIDSPIITFEYLDEARYCFAFRSDDSPEFWNLSNLIVGLSATSLGN